jgi:CrcB protein
MQMILSISIGAVIGALSRYFLIGFTGKLLGTSFPWGTLLVNVLGSLLMGILVELFALKWSASQEVRALLTVGLLGAFTTFSTFSLDVALLIQKGENISAFTYSLASVILSVAALFAGLHLIRNLLS